MLPAAARVHSRSDHRLVAKTGCRARRGSVLLALAAAGHGSPRATVVAGRSVGPAVVRNRVKRQLREHVRARLGSLPAGSLLVVRALPGSAQASFSELGSWVESGLTTCVKRVGDG